MMRKKKKQLPTPTVKLCPACKGTTFTEKNLPAQDGLPAVRGWMCAKCGRTYWHKNESLAYQKAKAAANAAEPKGE